MFLIDLEVYLVPIEIVTEKETGLMSGDMSGGEFLMIMKATVPIIKFG